MICVACGKTILAAEDALASCSCQKIVIDDSLPKFDRDAYLKFSLMGRIWGCFIGQGYEVTFTASDGRLREEMQNAIGLIVKDEAWEKFIDESNAAGSENGNRKFFISSGVLKHGKKQAW